ncbi:MAG: hypothetical protein M3H12_08890 [Chromatiales bacterium]|nr:hypothetical protein [Gammaproteobacteria bacterium]
MKKHKRARCAITGRFISIEEALRRPDTTIIETYMIKPRRKRDVEDDEDN